VIAAGGLVTTQRKRHHKEPQQDIFTVPWERRSLIPTQKAPRDKPRLHVDKHAARFMRGNRQQPTSSRGRDGTRETGRVAPAGFAGGAQFFD
jgi:hypothetical protein